MAEVPEHLLERSRARRAALGLGGGDAPEQGTAPAATPAPADSEGAAPAAAPAAAAPPPIEPEPEPEPVIRHRRRVPAFVMPVLIMLPVWAMLYAGAFGERHTEEELTPAQLGQQLYTAQGCAGCHGGNGEGGVGPALGDVETVFPEIADHMAWIKGGAASVGVGNPYGDPAAGRIARAMPAFPNLSDDELEALATYEREAFGG